MSTVIQKYKKLIAKKRELTLNKEYLKGDLGFEVRSRKNHRNSYNTVVNKHYKNGITDKTQMQKDIEMLIEKRTKKIKEILPKLKENKKKLQKVNIELSNLCG